MQARVAQLALVLLLHGCAGPAQEDEDEAPELDVVETAVRRDGLTVDWAWHCGCEGCDAETEQFCRSCRPCGSPHCVERGCLAPKEVVVAATGPRRAEVEVTRHGVHAKVRKQEHEQLEELLIQFGPKAAHEEFAVQAGEPLKSVYFRTSEVCGCTAFTQPSLMCAEGAQKGVVWPRRVPPRAFGVELEMVGRQPSPDQVYEFDALALNAPRGVAPASCDSAEHEDCPQPGHWDVPALEVPAVWRASGLNQSGAAPTGQGFRDPRDPEEAKKLGQEPPLRVLSELQELQACWLRAQLGARGPCEGHQDCPAADFCAADRQCRPREHCAAFGGNAAIDHQCPPPLTAWRWETDVTVHPFRLDQALALLGPNGKLASELKGVEFELISPAPPHALSGASGLASVAETLGLLSSMGVQAGPSQGLHVHVNVGRPGQAPTSGPGAGASLTTRQMANVWAQYAKYQLVIDEFLQDSRVGSEWSQGLYFQPLDVVDMTQAGRAVAGVVKDAVHSTRARYSEAVFRKLHRWTKEHFGTADERHFCNYVLSQGQSKKKKQDLEKALGMTPGSDELEAKGPCEQKYPSIRYMSVNLAVLNRYGTIEFRAFPASPDPERVTSWAEFLLAFVEAAKDQGAWSEPADDMEALRALQTAQQQASLEDLEKEVGMSLDYLGRRRPWLQGPACVPQPLEETAASREKTAKVAQSDAALLEDAEVQAEAAAGARHAVVRQTA